MMGLIMALGGMAQNFAPVRRQPRVPRGRRFGARACLLFAARRRLPARTLTRAFALLQFGFIGGVTLGPIFGGMLIAMTVALGADRDLPGCASSAGSGSGLGRPARRSGRALFLTVKEPPRLAPR